jgi:hypothetical protein
MGNPGNLRLWRAKAGSWRHHVVMGSLLALFLLTGAFRSTLAAELPEYPDPDTDKVCTKPGESPECAAKTFWLCSEKSVATCKLAGLNVQADGTQHKDDGTLTGDAWLKPWTLSWTDLLNVTHSDYTVWEIKGLRETSPGRLRGVPWNRRNLAGAYEMMINMVTSAGVLEKESIFLVQRKGAWLVTGFAKWREGEIVNACERRKLGSLACRYTVTGLSPWEIK